MASSYYYLIAGLPELNLEQSARGFDHLALKQYVAAQLSPEDLPLWEAIYLPYDNRNLLNVLLEQRKPFNPLGKYTQEEVEKMLQEPADASQYMQHFIEEFRSAKETKSDAELTSLALETKLNTLFYAYAEGLNNKFLHRWYSFDRQLRNLQAALLNRQLKREANFSLVGNDDITEALSKNMSADFGLKGEVDGLEMLMQIFDHKDVVAREHKLDELRWQMADEYTAFDYFALDKVLAYAVKLQLIDRWTNITKEAGSKKLQSLLAEIHSSFS
ncbi:MAG: DUF2764 domain-containing protein [Prevotellaceae bacterium]|jgi:hypothetical protein|nr:DUF2764 domain-containing protein [Prevotellaceae bacterium]